jgi:tetratricopeptide (TPR) repeat protein
LRATLMVGASERLGRPPTADLAAYDLYLRGREQDGQTRDGNTAAIALLREAIRLDPGFAGAHAALSARIAERLELHSFPVEWADSGIALARKAIELDAELPSAYLALSHNLWHTGRFRESAAAARRALELDPNDANAMEGLFWAEYYMGNHGEALHWALRGYRVNPRLAWLPNSVGVAYAAIGEHAQAERWLIRSLELDPDYLWAHFNLCRLELYLGRADDARGRAEALHVRYPTSVPALLAMGDVAAYAGEWSRASEHYQRAYDLAPDSDHHEPTRLHLALALTRTGQASRAAALLDEAETAAETALAGEWSRRGGAWQMGVIHSLRGEPDEALRWLEVALKEGWSNSDQARHSPFFDALRRHPAFESLLRRLEDRRAEWRTQVETIG